jgi:tetratricopeptide (TPR) repeat protein
VLPLGNEWTVAAAAPDLWSMRATVITVPDRIASFDSSLDQARLNEPNSSLVSRPGPSAELPEEVRRVVLEWKRNASLPSPGRSALISGVFAFDLIKPFDEVAATEIANELLVFYRNNLGTTAGENRESLRDVSVSLIRVGDMAQARGDLEGAHAAYVESLEVSRRVVSVFGENRESLRDVSVSLDRVGDMAQVRGDLEGANAAYVESLEVSRRVVSVFGENRESLRDVSVSLNRVGDMAKARGDLEDASAAYVESLAVRRRVVSVFGENRQSLDDLALNLMRVGGLINLKEARLILGRLNAIDHNDAKWLARLAFVNSAIETLESTK